MSKFALQMCGCIALGSLAAQAARSSAGPEFYWLVGFEWFVALAALISAYVSGRGK